MSVLFPDTSPEAEAVLINLLRQASPWRKMEMIEWSQGKMLTFYPSRGFANRLPKRLVGNIHP